jgi:lipoprotein LpqH
MNRPSNPAESPSPATRVIRSPSSALRFAGGDVGNAEASTDGNIYTITGTAVGADQAHPGQTRTMPFEIKAPC